MLAGPSAGVTDNRKARRAWLSISYTIPGEKFRDIIEEVRFSLIGKNLLTFTDYSGWDPEVTKYDGSTQQYFAVDYGVYPTSTTYSFSFQIKF